MGKRVQGQAFLNGAIDHGAHFCTYLLGTDMEMNTPDGFALMNWETGYGDWIADPVWDTLRVVPWLEKTALVLADTVDDHGARDPGLAAHHAQAPGRRGRRHGLPRQGRLGVRVLPADRYLRAGLARRATSASSASATTTRTTTCSRRPRREPIHGRLRNLMTEAGIPVEFSKGEAAPGQHEVNIHYADVLEMADRVGHLQARRQGDRLAQRLRPHLHGQARPHLDRLERPPAHGAVGPDRRRRRSSTTRRAEPYGMSETMRHFLGGMMKLSRELAIFLAPNVNSYKRYAVASLGAGQRGLGPRQPHHRLPDRGRRAGAAHREPLPRRRHEPVPHLCGGGRRGAVRHRARDRAAGRVRGQRLRGHRLRPHAARAARGDPRAGGVARRRSRSSAPTSWTTTSTRRASSRRHTTRSSIPGSASDTWSAADAAARTRSRHHRRRQRHGPRGRPDVRGGGRQGGGRRVRRGGRRARRSDW